MELERQEDKTIRYKNNIQNYQPKTVFVVYRIQFTNIKIKFIVQPDL